MNKTKRIMDIIISIIVIIICIPLFLVIALAIFIDDRGPVLFQQWRVSRSGRKFKIYKFRKFSVCNENAGSKLTFCNDKRYSRVGRILEFTKLNELPQLINVLKGEMSIVGPRPEIVEFSHCFSGENEELLNFYPGIFGPSQTIFRNESKLYSIYFDPKKYNDFEEFYESVLFPAKAKIDIEYYNNANCLSDLLWIYHSVSAVFKDFVPELVDGVPVVKTKYNNNA